MRKIKKGKKILNSKKNINGNQIIRSKRKWKRKFYLIMTGSGKRSRKLLTEASFWAPENGKYMKILKIEIEIKKKKVCEIMRKLDQNRKRSRKQLRATELDREMSTPLPWLAFSVFSVLLSSPVKKVTTEERVSGAGKSRRHVSMALARVEFRTRRDDHRGWIVS